MYKRCSVNRLRPEWTVKRFAEWCLNAALFAVAAAAVASVVLRWRQPIDSERASGSLKPTRFVEWRKLAGEGHRLGAVAPKVTIVWFSDFQCPFCREASATIRRIALQHPDEVLVVYRHYPMDFHADARAAALAAVCAASQDRFNQMESTLFSHQESLGRLRWTQLASMAGVADTVRLARCMTEEASRATIARDSAAAVPLGVPGTPTIFVNEWRFDGFPGARTLEEYAERALAERN